MESAGYMCRGKITPKQQIKVRLSNKVFSDVLFSMMISFYFVNTSHFLEPVAPILSISNLLIEDDYSIPILHTRKKSKISLNLSRKAEKYP